VDVTDVAAVDAAIDAVAARAGGLHVLVNCAGWDKPMPFVDSTPEFWDRILAINLKGPIACTRAAISCARRIRASMSSWRRSAVTIRS